jgi:hypothetical protein
MNKRKLRMAVRIFNCLFKDRLRLFWCAERCSLARGPEHIFDSVMYGSPKRDARVFHILYEKIRAEGVKRSGEWYGTAFDAAVEKAMEAC